MVIQSTVLFVARCRLIVQQLQCSSIKFCSHNFVLNEASNNNDVTHIANIVLNEAPNNNDVMCIANIVLNEASNSNDTMHVWNNVCLTTMGAQQFSVVAIQPSCRKADLPEMRDNDMITRKVCADGNKLCPGKEWRLCMRSISVGRQVVR